MDSSPARLLCPWNSPDKNNGVGCHFLLQGIFLTQGSSPDLLLWQEDPLLSHHGVRGIYILPWSLFHLETRVLLYISTGCHHWFLAILEGL